MTLRLTIVLCLVAVFAPAAMAQFGFDDDESSVSEAAAVISDRGLETSDVLRPLQPLRAAIDPVLPVLRPIAEPDIDAANDVDALIESCGFQPQVARAYRAAEIAGEDEDCPEYLGRLSANPYAADSTANPYSEAGSPYSSTSVNNRFGPYGSPFSPTSARNPYATDAPKIVAQDGTYLGELSDNPYDPDSVANPYGRYGSPYSPTSINNPYSTYGSPYSPQSPNNPFTTQAPLLFGD
jgi:hypothetical protein